MVSRQPDQYQIAGMGSKGGVSGPVFSFPRDLVNLRSRFRIFPQKITDYGFFGLRRLNTRWLKKEDTEKRKRIVPGAEKALPISEGGGVACWPLGTAICELSLIELAVLRHPPRNEMIAEQRISFDKNQKLNKLGNT